MFLGIAGFIGKNALLEVRSMDFSGFREAKITQIFSLPTEAASCRLRL
jgi:hypothetical protein